ncbi:MAG: protein kinase [Holophagales bacterium]|nr:protein kinase [Holophagales bacterium]
MHEAGLVHRDVKPENVILTRAGRVVLMDFGIAKAVASGGTVAGTPAYWPPEQAAGAPADPRADVFAAGIVLAEMVAPGGTREPAARRAVWHAMRDDSAKVPATPWSEAIRKAVSHEPRDRFPSAQALARALEEVTHPHHRHRGGAAVPGLASFTEAEAQYFFGREAEVEGV